MTLDCDVLVVGAGPAGSSAARAAAISGAKTIFIDKKREIGVPVQCAEGIGQSLFPFLPFEIPKELLIWKIDGMSFWAEDVTIERTGGFWSGYAINREKFDKWLANNAVKCGATLYTNTELIKLDIENDYLVKKATVKTPDGEEKIKPKVVIAADGVTSRVLKELGFNNFKDKCGKVLSFEMKSLDLQTPKYDQLYTGDFAPGASAYIFPKSKNRANIGVASLFSNKKLEKCYEEFLEIPQVKKQLRNGITVTEKSGWAPYCNLTDKWIYGNVLLVGDAANQNLKPFVEGILPAIICGNIAGRTATDHLINNLPLDTYITKIKDQLGEFFNQSDLITKIICNLNKSSDKKSHLLWLGLSANIFSPSQIEELKNEGYEILKNKLKIEVVKAHN